jgi:hypothetical protein
MTHECVSDEAVATDVEKYGLSVWPWVRIASSAQSRRKTY